MQYGIDVGRSAVKAVSAGERLYMPAMLRTPVPDSSDVAFKEPRVEVRQNGFLRIQSLPVSYHGERWILGDEQHRMGYSCVSPMEVVKASHLTRLLLLGAVAAMGGGPEVDVCVGLPISFYRAERQKLMELLRGEHQVGVDGTERVLQVKAVVVVEGFGLLMRACRLADGALDMDGLRRSTLVIDFGHRTTQFCLFRRGRVASVSFSLRRAMGEVFDSALRELVDARLGNPFDPAAHTVMGQDLVAQGTITVNGLTVTYQEALPTLQKYARLMWPELQAEMRRVLTGATYDRVVAGGGGVHLLEDELREFYGGRVEVLGDRYAQAEGYLDCLESRKQLMEL